MFRMKKILNLLIVSLMFFIIACQASFAEDIPEPGLEKALAKADEFNAWMRERTDREIADEMHISIWNVLSPYGTEAPPDPLITANEGDTWDDLVHRLLKKYGVDEGSVGIGYYNTVTGEEHYINPDQYMVSASMFKVPLNMIFADKISSGEMALDTDIWGMPYNWYQYKSIVESDNERSYTLMQWLGNYAAFKEQQIPYLGNDPREDLGAAYDNENYYNARQFIHVLRMLYDEPARFPGVLENMLQAEPYSYFHQYERRYPIAQKYGFVQQQEPNRGYHTYINTCGIVFADQPFCIVMFTDNVSLAYDLISEYCMVMCDYSSPLVQTASK